MLNINFHKTLFKYIFVSIFAFCFILTSTAPVLFASSVAPIAEVDDDGYVNFTAEEINALLAQSTITIEGTKQDGSPYSYSGSSYTFTDTVAGNDFAFLAINGTGTPGSSYYPGDSIKSIKIDLNMPGTFNYVTDLYIPVTLCLVGGTNYDGFNFYITSSSLSFDSFVFNGKSDHHSFYKPVSESSFNYKFWGNIYHFFDLFTFNHFEFSGYENQRQWTGFNLIPPMSGSDLSMSFDFEGFPNFTNPSDSYKYICLAFTDWQIRCSSWTIPSIGGGVGNEGGGTISDTSEIEKKLDELLFLQAQSNSNQSQIYHELERIEGALNKPSEDDKNVLDSQYNDVNQVQDDLQNATDDEDSAIDSMDDVWSEAGVDDGINTRPGRGEGYGGGHRVQDALEDSGVDTDIDVDDTSSWFGIIGAIWTGGKKFLLPIGTLLWAFVGIKILLFGSGV